MSTRSRQRLVAASVRGYFQMVAEAGLFRISENENSNS
jgi:hypothetical protein